jgi:hypothetical protein
MTNDSCIIGGIVRHRHGYGFRISFSNPNVARKYKEAFQWYIEADDIEVETKRGYYDML